MRPSDPTAPVLGMTRSRLLLSGAGLIVLAVAAMAATSLRPRQIVLVGVVDANEVVVTPPVQARLDSVWIEEGSAVEAGQLLASLDQHELAAQAEAASASPASMRAQLDQASVSAMQAEGEAAGNQAGARARLASARAELARQDAELTRQRSETERTVTLSKNAAVSQSELDRATTALSVQEQVVEAAREALRAAEADVNRAKAGALAAEAARGGVLATRARLRGAQADSAAARTRLAYTELRAPVAGIVQVLVARRGELVGPGAPVAVLIDPDHPWVRVAAPESDAGAVAVGDSLDVRFASGLRVRGRVVSKSAAGEFATQHDVSTSKRDIRAIAFRVALPNPRRVIVPGMTAEVLLPTVARGEDGEGRGTRAP